MVFMILFLSGWQDLSNLRTREHLSHLSDLELSPAASSIKVYSRLKPFLS